MTIKKIVFVVAVLSFMLVSCTSEQDDRLLDLFADKYAAVKVNDFSSMDVDSIRKPYLLACADSTLCLVDYAAGSLLSLFDKDSGKWLAYSLNRGTGPDEYLHIANIQTVNNRLFLWDSGKSEVTLSRFENDTLKSCHSFSVDPDSCLISAFQVFPLSETRFVASGIIREKRLALLDEKGKVRNTFGDYPMWQNKKHNDAKNGVLYQPVCAYQVNKKILAVATTMTEALDFYDMSDSFNPRLIRTYRGISPQYVFDGDDSVVFSKETQIGFVKVVADENYCVALFGEGSFSSGEYGGNILLLFDWAGTPLKAVRLNQTYSALTLDKEQRRIYLLGTDDRDFGYKISVLLLDDIFK